MAEVQHIVREASCADVSDLRTSTSHTLPVARLSTGGDAYTRAAYERTERGETGARGVLQHMEALGDLVEKGN